MSDFKKGDLVKCIDNEGYEHQMTLDKTYIVEDFDGTVVKLKEDDRNNIPMMTEAFPRRFKKVEVRQISTQELIKKVCGEVTEILLDKNRKYGDSAINPQRIFSKCDALEQINVRIDDKISRILSAQGDDAEDAEFDLLGYLVLKRVAREVQKYA